LPEIERAPFKTNCMEGQPLLGNPLYLFIRSMA